MPQTMAVNSDSKQLDLMTLRKLVENPKLESEAEQGQRIPTEALTERPNLAERYLKQQ